MASSRRSLPTAPTRRPRVAGMRRSSDQPVAPAEWVDDEFPRSTEGSAEVTTQFDTFVRDEEPTPEADAGTASGGDTSSTDAKPAGDAAPAPAAAPKPKPKPRATAVLAPPIETTLSGSRKSKVIGTMLAEPTQAPLTADEDDAADAADAPDAATEAGDAPARSRRRLSGLNLAIALAVLAAGLAGLAYWFHAEANAAKAGTDNVALTDPANTSEVAGQVRDAVNTIFSYSYTDVAKTTNAAKGLLVGDAVGQYDKLMQSFAKDIQSQKLQVTLNTVRTGVISLTGDNARVLVFADQTAVRADQSPTGGATLFLADVRRQDGRWKIVNFDFFDGTPTK